jgi:hypothetical protein
VAQSPPFCGPQCGGGGISPSAYDGQKLYIAAGRTTINGTWCTGSLRAFDPNNMSGPLWQHCMASGPVLGAVTAAPGIAVVGEGSYMTMVETGAGATVFSGAVSNINTSSPAIFYGPATISHGVLYEGDTAGNLYAYSVNGL